MADYLLIESRDWFGRSSDGFCADLAKRLARQGDSVTVFLVQNGVLPARAGARAPGLAELARSGVEVLADAFSLRERGIATDRLAPGVKPAPLEIVIDRLAQGAKTLWH